MPCDGGTECKCTLTLAYLVQLGNVMIDSSGNCKNSECGHSVGKHTDTSSAGSGISVRQKFENLLGLRLNDVEWAQLLNDQKAMHLDALSTSAEAKLTLDTFRMRVRTVTARQISVNSGYMITSQTLPGYPHVQLGHNRRLKEFVFKSFSNPYDLDKEEKCLKLAHNLLPNPYVCESVACLHENGKHLLVVPKYGSASNDILPHGERLSEEQILFVAMSLAAGLLPLHLQEICWADIKPQNIVLGEGRCVIVDAGSVCRFGEHVRSTTPLYTLGVDAVGGSRLDLVCMASTLFWMMAPDLWLELLKDSDKRLGHQGQPSKSSLRAKCQKFVSSNPQLVIVQFLLDEPDLISFILRFENYFHNERPSFEEPWRFVCTVLAAFAGPFVQPILPAAVMTIANSY